MTVKELIEELKTCNPDAIVVNRSDIWELNGSIVRVSYVLKSSAGSSEMAKFKDPFDDTYYDFEIFDLFDGDQDLVMIY